MIYKIINITDREGNIKEEFIKEMKKAHPGMKGQLLYPINKSACLYFVWVDDSEKMLFSSPLDGYIEQDNILIVTTQNSIYTLERIG